MKRAFERNDIGPSWLLARVPIPPGEFQAGFDRLGAAVAEEGALQTREPREPLRELALQRVVEEVGAMKQLPGL